MFKCVDGPAGLLQFANRLLFRLYGLALTRVSFRDFPLRYEMKGGSLKIFHNRVLTGLHDSCSSQKTKQNFAALKEIELMGI